MTAPIVVGVDGTGSGLDAVALAARLAQATGDPLIVACVYPEGRPSSGDAAAVRGPATKALEAAEALAEEAAAEYRTVPSSSPARGWPSWPRRRTRGHGGGRLPPGGAFGRVASDGGATAARLRLPGGGGPRGYRQRVTDKLQRVGVAFVDRRRPRGGPLRRRPGGTVGPPSPCSRSSASTSTGSCPRPSGLRRRRFPSRCARTTRRRWTGPWPGFRGVQASGELLYGEVVDELSMVGERGVDLLVCGSRGYGPVRRVLLGTVSAALVRQASVPVLVVPRGGG